jgi:isopenicillin-N epimerase
MPSPFAELWTLDPAVTFLNHGSYGATPRAVLEAQAAWRARMEAEPVRFFVRDLEPALDAARAVLAAFVGCAADDLAPMPNATTAISTVLASLDLAPGDELLTTDHAYNAARNALDRVAHRTGARVVVAPVSFPLRTADEIVAPILAAATDRTRLAVVDHVTSASALVLPIGRIVAELGSRGIDTLVDGAHAPGMVELDIGAIGAAYYAGNLHKWVCAPKGAGFLWVRPDRQAPVRPLAVSHGANSPRTDRTRFRLEFDWTGTADPSPFLSVPAALEFGAGLLPGGWPALRRRNHGLALVGRDLVCRGLDVLPPAPDELIGSMASLPLPPRLGAEVARSLDVYGDPVHDALAELGMQTMIASWPQRPEGRGWQRMLRLSAAPYNDRDDMERLAEALPGVLAAIA